jgi:DinB superfamily
MMTQFVTKPGDYAENYGKYVALAPEGDLLDGLVAQLHNVRALLSPLSESQGDFRYAPGKWTIKQSIGHINDAERVFSYRLLRFARADQTPLPGFEQDDYIEPSNFGARSMPDLLDEFAAVRHSTIALVKSMDNAAWMRAGVASGKQITTVALALVIFGHVQHHVKIFEKNYLPALRSA